MIHANLMKSLFLVFFEIMLCFSEFSKQKSHLCPNEFKYFRNCSEIINEEDFILNANASQIEELEGIEEYICIEEIEIEENKEKSEIEESTVGEKTEEPTEIESFEYEEEKKDKEKEDQYDDYSVYKTVCQIINHSMPNNISVECRQMIEDIFNEEIYDVSSPHHVNLSMSKHYIDKFMYESSRNKNDLTNYKNCLSKDDQNNDYHYKSSFMIVRVDKSLDKQYLTQTVTTKYFDDRFILGYCIPNVCSNEVFQNFTFKFYENLNDIYSLTKPDQIYLFFMESYEPKIDNFAELIPAIIIILIFIIILFHIFPFCLLKNCFKNKKNRKKLSLDSKSEAGFSKTKYGKYNKALFYKFKECFIKTKILEELFDNTGKDTKYYKLSGLTYIKGLMGLSMLFMILGSVFFDLFNSRNNDYNEFKFLYILCSFTFGFFNLGMKVAPRMFISCSGYILVYKFMCFLDNSVEEERHLKEEILEAGDQNKERSRLINFEEKIEKGEVQYKTRSYSDVKAWFYFKFLSYQIHKYIIFVFFVFFVRYSSDSITNLLNSEKSPMSLIFYRESVKNLEFGDLILFITTIRSFYFWEDDDIPFNFIIYYWILPNEFLFFIIGTLIIFIGYKYKLRLDRFMFIAIPSSIIIKLVIYLIIRFDKSLANDNSDGYVLYPTIYFYTFDYTLFMNSPIFNFPYYLIGMFFGFLNYTLQKGYTYIEANSCDKVFIFIFIRFNEALKKLTKGFIYFLLIIGLILILIFGWSTFIFLYLAQCASQTSNKSLCIVRLMNDDLSYESYFTSIGANIFNYIDIGIIIFMLHFVFFCCYIKGNNILNEILSSNFWNIFLKLNFSFLLILNFCILYVFSQSESLIEFNIQNINLYSVIILFIVIIFSILVHLFFEMPFKRLIRFLYEKDKIGVSLTMVNEGENNENEPIHFTTNLLNDDDEEDNPEKSIDNLIAINQI